MNDIQAKSVLIVRKNKLERLFNDQILIEEIGAKAFGLSKIPSAWTLPFFVISTEMYEMYTSGIDISDIKKTWNENIITAMEQMKFDFDQNIYLRSNMCEEGLEKRGQFESYDCSIENLFETIKIYFDSFKDIDVSQIKMPLLIQQYSQTLGKGHISNEKRLSKAHRDWQGEIEGLHKNSTANVFEKIFKIPLRRWRQSVDINEAIYRPLRCSSLDNIKQVLIYPCWWATIRQDRIHFEWIFDGMYIYIVQADVEKDYGINPMTLYKNSYHLEPHTFKPQILHRLSSEDRDKYSSYSKVRNPLLYTELGFKIAPLYILDDQQEIQRLINQEISEYLKNDIQAILTTPLVIRTDIDMLDISAKQMLPRTDDVCNAADAINWLKCKSKELYSKYGDQKKFIFIIHNFIPAFTSAFAYAEPNTRCVLMESLWGVPEGLYYYTHDKYIVDTMNSDFAKVNLSKIMIEEDINAKTNFIFPNRNGEWKYNSVSTSYIWRPAITKTKWVKEIALSTRKIAERIGEGVSVMWFVGVNPKEYGCNVLP